jgi:hypothetical protein
MIHFFTVEGTSFSRNTLQSIINLIAKTAVASNIKNSEESKVWPPEQALDSKGSSLRSHLLPRSRAARNSLIKQEF